LHLAPYFRVAIYKKMGIALGPDDPAFALVEMNRVVLEEMIEDAVARLANQLNALPERIQSCSSAVASELASQGVQRVVEMLVGARRTIAADAEQAQQRFAEQTAKAGKALDRQVVTIVRATEPPLRGDTVRDRARFSVGTSVSATSSQHDVRERPNTSFHINSGREDG